MFIILTNISSLYNNQITSNKLMVKTNKFTD